MSVPSGNEPQRLFVGVCLVSRAQAIAQKKREAIVGKRRCAEMKLLGVSGLEAWAFSRFPKNKSEARVTANHGKARGTQAGARRA